MRDPRLVRAPQRDRENRQHQPCQTLRLGRAQISGEHKCQHREHRQNIRDQFRAGLAEKQQYEYRVNEQELERRKRARRSRKMRRALPALRDRRNQCDGPRQKSREQNRYEIPPRLFASMHGAQESFEMFMDKKELRKFRIPDGDQREPRHGNGEKYQRAHHPFQFPQQSKIALKRTVKKHRRRRKNDADESFGEHRRRHARPRHPQPAPPRIFGRRMLRNQQRRYGKRHPQRESHIERDDLGHRGKVRRTQHHEPCQHAGFCVEETFPRVRNQQDAGEPAKCRVEPRGEFALAEQGEGNGGRPILQGRLFKILQPIQSRRNVIARRRHLARDFRIAPLIRIRELAIPQAIE